MVKKNGLPIILLLVIIVVAIMYCTHLHAGETQQTYTFYYEGKVVAKDLHQIGASRYFRNEDVEVQLHSEKWGGSYIEVSKGDGCPADLYLGGCILADREDD